MKGCLSRITCQVRVSAITKEKFDHGTVTMEGGIVERGETTPTWYDDKHVRFKDVALLTDLQYL